MKEENEGFSFFLNSHLISTFGYAYDEDLTMEYSTVQCLQYSTI